MLTKLNIIFILICFLFIFPNISKSSTQKDENNMQEVPTIITSDGPLNVDFAKNIAVFHDNVVIIDPKGDVYADLMKFFFDGQTKHISIVEATGNVVIKVDNKVAKSDKALYKVEEGVLELTGNPRILEDKNVYTADKIIIFRKNGKTEMKLEPRAKLLLYRGDLEDNGLLF
ncbi:hypothetical protein J7L67_07065 [bacterium]|nr:hypothetical protein [bacterium]